MTPDTTFQETLEPERYELASEPAYHFEPARRELFRMLGAGLLVLWSASESDAVQEVGGGRRGGGQALPQDIGAWLHIGEDGRVTVFTGKAEVGQNIRTSLTQAVAEELRVPVASIVMVMGDTMLTPYDMGTFGSRTTPTMAPQLRRAAASARESLLDLAAEQWKADRGTLTVVDGAVADRAHNRSLTFGQLAKGQALARPISRDAPLTPAPEWKLAGTSVPKVDARAMVTGAHRYTVDVSRPGMLYGKVLRSPALRSVAKSVDVSAAKAMSGVTVVRDGEFTGVTAPNSHTAEQAITAIRAEWKTEPQIAGRDLYSTLKKPIPGRDNAAPPGPDDPVAAALAASHRRLDATYTVAYIAHAPLEPRAALAEWEGDHLTVWTGTQRPFGVRGELSQAFRLPEANIRVIVPDTGSGYGGKHTGEAAIEAAKLARATGKPVKLVWTREEEFTWAYFRPAGVIDIRSGVSQDGRLQAWEYHNYNSGTSGIATPYDIGKQRVEFHDSDAPLRQGSYRGLAATANHFARESHMDELAYAVSADPLAFRLNNLSDLRVRAVLEAAANQFGWAHRRKATPGQGFGLACGTEKGGYIATCAEVHVDRASGNIRVVRVVSAFECGAIVNPDHLKNQIEGANMMAIGGALFEAIAFDKGQILNARFSKYRVPRFTDMPRIEVVLVNRKDLPSAGAGETPIVGLAPAVGNAVFDAVGTRLRSLPMTLDHKAVGV